jgi:hypothetical protein
VAARWRKLGRTFEPQPVHPKLLTHAANPLPIHLEGDIYRVLYGGRDQYNRSSVGFVDIDVLSNRVLRVSDRPVFEHGCEGSFYSHGVSVGCHYQSAGSRFVLFMGWQVPEGQHWRGEVGRLLLDNSLEVMTLDPQGPLLGRDDTDPLSLSYPWVSARGSELRMWYGSTVAWDAGNGEMLHVIQSATSVNGLDWVRHGTALPSQLGVAQAFSRPVVLDRDFGEAEMWFAYRGPPGRTYRIGYATMDRYGAWSLNLDEVGIDVSESGWDSEMICYPFVLDHAGQRYMFYNGNGYGRTGFGIAILEG